jgi:glycosyltransferase involved in cell wall biosynthesis
MRSLRVLRVHNFYREQGGEDSVFEAEERLLRHAGHSIVRYQDDNGRIVKGSLATGLQTIWSQRSYRSLDTIGTASRLDVAHFHNTFPLVSPSAYYAVRKHEVPVVQTLHNYRLLCPGATFYRNGKVCEDCLNGSLAPALRHGCYRSSRPATAAVAAMLVGHRGLGTWQRMVDVYIALSEFARRKYIEGGLPEDRIVVKSNFIDIDPGLGRADGDHALFVGRVSEEKGVRTLLDAWGGLPKTNLRVIGRGPLEDRQLSSGIEWTGSLPHDQVIAQMRAAKVLVVPSNCYESAPMVIVEAFATGLPVIASNHGAMAGMIRDLETGLLFRPGDPEDLAAKVRWAFDHPQELAAMRVAARREFEGKYTAERNYKMLMEIYDLAIENARGRRPAA